MIYCYYLGCAVITLPTCGHHFVGWLPLKMFRTLLSRQFTNKPFDDGLKTKFTCALISKSMRCESEMTKCFQTGSNRSAPLTLCPIYTEI